MIELYTSPTPNGYKVSIMLEETGLDYIVHPIDMAKQEQKEPGFLAMNPNGRIPVIADIACWPWASTHRWSGIDIDGLDNLQAWIVRMGQRPAVAKGKNIPVRGSKNETTKAGQSIIVT